MLVGLWVLLGANVFAWPYVLKADALWVTFFDVGQGDAIFIETPQGHQMLIDGGPDNAVLEKLGSAMPFWDRDIDLVILTHPDKDHVAGLIGVLKEYKVENVLWTGVQKDTKLFEKWKQALQKEGKEGARVEIAHAPQKVVWSKSKSSFIDILYPLESLEGKNPKDTNNTSLVSKLVFDKASFLLPGDISHKIEKSLLAEGIDLRADILKVAHHGSKSSSARLFLAAASPELAVIEVGKENRYGHPYQEVIERFEELQIPILRTDQNGDIVIRSDGNKFWVTAENL